MTVREVWAIAGPSGCGKSTLSFALEEKFAGELVVLQLDDYFKPKEDVPMLDGFTNWDSPEALKFDEMALHVEMLKRGETVHMMTKKKTVNPDYEVTRKKVPIAIKPSPIVVLEGYLILHDLRLRGLIDKAVFLNLPADVRQKRRDKLAMPGYEGYNDRVLEPMISQYVMPTQRYATRVIEVGDKTPADVLVEAMKVFG